MTIVKGIKNGKTIPPQLQLNFKTKLNQDEKEISMPFLSTLEEMALEQGAKETRQQDIIDLLQKRFGELPESLTKAITKVEDSSFLKQLHLETKAR